MAYKVKQEGNTSGTLYRRLLAFRGLYTRVAKQQNVSRQFVHQVAHGLRKSKRIEVALQRELKRTERRLLNEQEVA